jgi:hypothetical protein
VSDVTIPDGTEMAPGEAFTKTWALANTGTCDWSGYSLVFHRQEQMGGPSAVPVADTAAGATTNVPVGLTAPSTPGTHTGRWTMRAPDGSLFGDIIYVEIVVVAPEEPGEPPEEPEITEEPEEPREPEVTEEPRQPGVCPTEDLKAPILVSPANGAFVTHTLWPTLTWRYPDKCHPEGYRIDLATDPSFRDTSLSGGTGNPSTSWAPAHELEPNTQYWWRVAPINGTTLGPYSEVWTFTVSVVY